METFRNLVIILWLLFGSLPKSSLAEECRIVINEINTDTPGILLQDGSSQRAEKREFIELKSVGCGATIKPRLKDYLLLIVKEYHKHADGPAIVLSADFYHYKWKPASDYFLIASKQQFSQYDMSFGDPSINFRDKKRFHHSGGTQASLLDFYKRRVSDVVHNQSNVLPNGNGYSPLAIVLLNQRGYLRQNDDNSSIASMKLDSWDATSRRPSIASFKKVTSEMASLMRNHTVDMVIYSRNSRFNRCNFFETVYKDLSAMPDYDIKPVREYDSGSPDSDKSANRCPKTETDLDMPFTHWKLGRPTPGEANDCNGAHWLLEDHIAEIRLIDPHASDEESLSEYTDRYGDELEACGNSSHQESMYNLWAHSDTITANRNAAIAAARRGITLMGAEKVCELQESRQRIETDQKLDALMQEVKRINSVLQTIQHSNAISGTSEPSSEPLPKRQRTEEEEVTGDLIHPPWQDERLFNPEWVETLIRYQGEHIEASWFTKKGSDIKTWMEYIHNRDNPRRSAVRCRICYTFQREKSIRNQHLPALAKMEGYIPSEKVKDSVRRKLLFHSATAVHLSAIDYAKLKHKETMKNYIEQQEDRVKRLLSKSEILACRMLRTVYAEVLANVPFMLHPSMVHLQKLNGLDMGQHHYSAKAAAQMVRSISDSMHKSLIEYVKTSGLPLSIILDTTTDKSSDNYLALYFRTIEKVPRSFFYRLVRLESETGDSLATTVSAMFREDGIQESVQEQLQGITSDGAAVMRGIRSGFAAKMEEKLHKSLYKTHCLAHKFQLVLLHAFESIPCLQALERHINSIYKFYKSNTAKRKASLRNTAIALDEVFYELKYIFQIRWVASEAAALSSIKRSYLVIATNLESIASDTLAFDADSKALATGLLKVHTNIRYYALHLFLLDLLNILSRVSSTLQGETISYIGLEHRLSQLLGSISRLIDENGPALTEFLASCQCRRVDPSAIGGIETEFRQRCTKADLDSSNFLCTSPSLSGTRIELKQPTVRCPSSTTTRGRGRPSREPCNQNSDSASGDRSFVEAVSITRQIIIESVIDQLQSYFPAAELTMFRVLDPKNFPNASSDLTIYSAGILPLARSFSILNAPPSEDVDWTILSREFEELLQSILHHNQADFCKYKTTNPVEFWSHFLSLNATVTWKPLIRRLVETVLVIPVSSAAVERGFSILKHARYDRRTSLLPNTLEAILRIRINGPPLEHFRPELYISSWLKQHIASDARGDWSQQKNAGKKLSSSLF